MSDKTHPASAATRPEPEATRFHPRQTRAVASGQRFPAPCILPRSFRGASLFELLPQLGGQIGSLGVTAQLQGANVSNDRPAVLWRDLGGVRQHLAEPVGDDIK